MHEMDNHLVDLCQRCVDTMRDCRAGTSIGPIGLSRTRASMVISRGCLITMFSNGRHIEMLMAARRH